MKMYCCNENVLWWWKCILMMEMYFDDGNILWWCRSILNEGIGEVLCLFAKKPGKHKKHKKHVRI